MSDWFVENDLERALGYVSPTSYACLDRFGEPTEGSSGDPRAQFMGALKTVSDFVGDIDWDALGDAIEGVAPWSPSFRDVTPNGRAFTLIAIPDDAVDTYRCIEDSAASESARRGEPAYGNFYGNAFRLKLVGGDQPGTFLVLWGQEESSWKVVAFDVIAE
jgi:hypothetical protein